MSEGPQNQPDEAMVDLLIKQVTEGLSPDEQRALDVLDSAVASAHLRGLERAAAAVALRRQRAYAAAPPALAERLARQANDHFAAHAGAGGTPADLAAARAAAAPAPRTAMRSGAYGWLAAAACLVLAVIAWNRTPPPAPPIVTIPPPAPVIPPPPPPPPPSATEQRAELLAKSDSIKIVLGATGPCRWRSNRRCGVGSGDATRRCALGGSRPE